MRRRAARTPFQRLLDVPVKAPEHPLATAIRTRGLTIAQGAEMLGMSTSALKLVISWQREMGIAAMLRVGAWVKDDQEQLVTLPEAEGMFPRIPDAMRAARED
jgi:hypothetical protein